MIRNLLYEIETKIQKRTIVRRKILKELNIKIIYLKEKNILNLTKYLTQLKIASISTLK
jgi:hypothetical protein